MEKSENKLVKQQIILIINIIYRMAKQQGPTLYSTGNYIQYPVMNHNEKEYIYYIYIYIYIIYIYI